MLSSILLIAKSACNHFQVSYSQLYIFPEIKRSIANFIIITSWVTSWLHHNHLHNRRFLNCYWGCNLWCGRSANRRFKFTDELYRADCTSPRICNDPVPKAAMISDLYHSRSFISTIMCLDRWITWIAIASTQWLLTCIQLIAATGTVTGVITGGEVQVLTSCHAAAADIAKYWNLIVVIIHNMEDTVLV